MVMKQHDICELLNAWYVSNCNGRWEHEYGISLQTLDNPGWSISIDLKETKLAGKVFQKIWVENDEDDWIHCEIKDEKFIASASPVNLQLMLRKFLEFAIQ
jgi:hypothetical protein